MGAKGVFDQAIVDEVLHQQYLVHDSLKNTGRETFDNTSDRELYGKIFSKRASSQECVATITRIRVQLFTGIAFAHWRMAAWAPHATVC